jgi:hypothetical protein
MRVGYEFTFTPEVGAFAGFTHRIRFGATSPSVLPRKRRIRNRTGSGMVAA